MNTEQNQKDIELVGHTLFLLRDPLTDQSVSECQLLSIGEHRVSFYVDDPGLDLRIGQKFELRLPVPFSSATVRATSLVEKISISDQRRLVKASYVLVLKGADEVLFETYLSLLLPQQKTFRHWWRSIWILVRPGVQYPLWSLLLTLTLTLSACQSK